MNNLFTNPDSTGVQARVVRAYLSAHDGLPSSYDHARKDHLVRPEITPWFNGRERGYVITLRNRNFSRQLNIAFFEHRNTDQICAWRWEQVTMNPPTIDTMVPKPTSGYAHDHAVNVHEGHLMADWIYGQLDSFWKEAST